MKKRKDERYERARAKQHFERITGGYCIESRSKNRETDERDSEGYFDEIAFIRTALKSGLKMAASAASRKSFLHRKSCS